MGGKCGWRNDDGRQPGSFDQNVIHIKFGDAAYTSGYNARISSARSTAGDVIVKILPRGRFGLTAISEPDFPEHIIDSALRNGVGLMTQPEPIPRVVLPGKLILCPPRSGVIQKLDVPPQILVPEVQVDPASR